jgi:hypothetical protein
MVALYVAAKGVDVFEAASDPVATPLIPVKLKVVAANVVGEVHENVYTVEEEEAIVATVPFAHVPNAGVPVCCVENVAVIGLDILL